MVTLITVVTVRTLFLFLLSIPPKVLTSVWSNFEIGDLDFWRGEAYSKFFDFLDERGGFYYEVSIRIWSSTGISSNSTLLWKRWGDAPVHSIGVSLFAKKEQIVSPVSNLFWVRSRQKLTWVLITISIFSMTSVRALWYLSRFFFLKKLFLTRLSTWTLPALSSGCRSQARQMLVRWIRELWCAVYYFSYTFF